MFGEKRHSGESLGTGATTVFLYLSVGLQVRAQVRAVCECARTMGTREWFLSSVCSHMSLKEPRARESLPTYRTLAWQRVSTNVHLERAQGRVTLVAKLAPEVLFNLRSAVELLVFGQSTEGGITLAASFAVVAWCRLRLGGDTTGWHQNLKPHWMMGTLHRVLELIVTSS